MLTKSLEVLNSRQVKEIMRMLEEQFGVKEKPGLGFLRSNKDKVYVINKDVDRINIKDFRVDSAGMYFGVYMKDGFRLSVEGSQFIGSMATKNVLELSLEQKHEWMKGNDISLNGVDNGFYIVKWKDDFLGCGKAKNSVLLNSVPKSRRLIIVNE